eukprot:PhF_6_TR12917/c1_g1_i2/m.20365
MPPKPETKASKLWGQAVDAAKTTTPAKPGEKPSAKPSEKPGEKPSAKPSDKPEPTPPAPKPGEKGTTTPSSTRPPTPPDPAKASTTATPPTPTPPPPSTTTAPTTTTTAPAPTTTEPPKPSEASLQEQNILARQIVELKQQLYQVREQKDSFEKKVKVIPELEKEVEKLRNAMFIREPERVAIHIKHLEEDNRRLRKQYQSAQEQIASQQQDISRLEGWISKLQRDIILLQATGASTGLPIRSPQTGDPKIPTTPVPTIEMPPAVSDPSKPNPATTTTATTAPTAPPTTAETPQPPPAPNQPTAPPPQTPPNTNATPVQPKYIVIPSPSADALQRTLGMYDPMNRPSACETCNIKIKALENSTLQLRLDHDKRQGILQNLLDGAQR